MSESRLLKPDLLIIGGGVAGLWTLLRARQAGYSALLLESRVLGGGQSMAAQGIIHGGTKYALAGRLSRAAQAVAQMPARWRACLQGRGELDLSRVRLLSAHQYLWGDGTLAGGLAGFFGSRAMRARVQRVAPQERPPPFDRPGFRGALYRLDEPVLDTASLLSELARQAAGHCHHCRPGELRLRGREVHLGDQRLQPRHLLLAAGEGNAGLLRALGLNAPAMQRRPLHMVMARGALPPLFAHVLEASANPRLTITSHGPVAGGRVWYLGGNLAEKGVALEARAQQARAAAELAALLPWLDLGPLRWATLRIHRAEVATPGGRRPDDVYLGEAAPGVLVAWPTKLALAPRLADRVLEALEGTPPSGDTVQLCNRVEPPLARLPWEEAVWS